MSSDVRAPFLLACVCFIPYIFPAQASVCHWVCASLMFHMVTSYRPQKDWVHIHQTYISFDIAEVGNGGEDRYPLSARLGTVSGGLCPPSEGRPCCRAGRVRNHMARLSHAASELLPL